MGGETTPAPYELFTQVVGYFSVRRISFPLPETSSNGHQCVLASAQKRVAALETYPAPTEEQLILRQIKEVLKSTTRFKMLGLSPFQS